MISQNIYSFLINLLLLNLTNILAIEPQTSCLSWKSWLLLSMMGDIIALWSERALLFLYHNRTCNTNKKFVLIFSLGYFLLVMSHVVLLVSIHYISCIWPIWFLFLTKPKPVCSYGNNLFFFPQLLLEI